MKLQQLNEFEKKALALFASHLEPHGAGFDWTKIGAIERDVSPLGFIVELGDPSMHQIATLDDGVTRYTLTVQHPDLANDGILTILLDRLGRPVELEAVSFDESEWPADSDVSQFVFAEGVRKA